MITPKTVALDSNQWADLIKDACGTDAELRREARRFPTALLERGYSILFSFHHFQELLAHENPSVVSSRLDYIEDIAFMSWVGPAHEDYSLGTVVDVIAAEAQVAYHSGGEAAEVRRQAKPLIIRSGPGADIIVDHELFRPLLSDWSRERSVRARSIASITAFPFSKPGQTVGELKSGTMASDVEVSRLLSSQMRNLSSEISNRGDRRINDADEVAMDFMREVIDFRKNLPGTVSDFVNAGFMMQGVDIDEIQDHLTVESLMDLGLFRSQLRIAAERTGVPFDILKRKVSRDQLPYFLISGALKPFQQRQSELRGSDLADRELACFAPYADVIYVDKRTAENLRQAFIRRPALAGLLGDVRKVINWRKVISTLP